MSIAVASAGVFMALHSSGTIETIRVALGSVSPVPIRSLKVETVLQGNRPSSELFARAAAEIDGDISPISDLRATAEYRRNSARVLLVRALESAWKQAESRMA
jgi:carbon-monoxide dehydrogenase medium subunit